MEASASIIKYVKSLSQKKNRYAEGCFVAEGDKCVADTMPHFSCRTLIATPQWLESHNHPWGVTVVQATARQMQRMSQFTTASQVIAIYEIPRHAVADTDITQNLNVVLDNVQDPGNLGTIIRAACWFGVNDIFCSPTTADAYSHKVIQATMGAISRVRVRYCDLPELLGRFGQTPIFGTFLIGESIYEADLTSTGFVLFGNEGKGISAELSQMVNRRLFIPPYPAIAQSCESLNVGMAASITLSEFRRRAV